jgi:cold shock CspA family protein
VAGRVQWIAAGKMMVIPDNGGLPVQVDLTQINQDQYKLLTEGAPVTVVGAVASDGPRVIATRITWGTGG